MQEMATMAHVAHRAGVSVTTVSHVVNETRKVSPETKQRVLDAIKELGYHKNALAEALAADQTDNIGVSISGALNPYFSALVHIIDGDITKHSYSMMMGDPHEDSSAEATLFSKFADWKVAGVICAPSPHAPEISLPIFAASSMPIVMVDRFLDYDCDQIAPDNITPVRELTQHLIDLGHKKIAAVYGKIGIHSTSERLQTFLTTMKTNSLTVPKRYQIAGNSTLEDSYPAVKNAFVAGEPPTAILSLNNAMTIGTFKALNELGLRVPDDVAVCSFDDFEWSDFFRPGITAARQNIELMGHRAVEMLLERINGYRGPSRRETIPVDVIYRDSSGTALKS